VLVDSAREFTKAIIELLQDVELRQRLSAGASATAGNFTWGATAEAFDRVLSGRPADVSADRPDAERLYALPFYFIP
jgi:glycosyltransferase involved in cell wall biosynthesis